MNPGLCHPAGAGDGAAFLRPASLSQQHRPSESNRRARAIRATMAAGPSSGRRFHTQPLPLQVSAVFYEQFPIDRLRYLPENEGHFFADLPRL